MYCVYQIDKNLDEKVFRIGYKKSDFIDRLTNDICFEHNAKRLVGITFDHIRSYECFTNAHYLLINGIQFQLVVKHKKTKKGFFSDSIWFETELLYTWKLLPLEENEEYPSDNLDWDTESIQVYNNSVNELIPNNEIILDIDPSCTFDTIQSDDFNISTLIGDNRVYSNETDPTESIIMHLLEESNPFSL